MFYTCFLCFSGSAGGTGSEECPPPLPSAPPPSSDIVAPPFSRPQLPDTLHVTPPAQQRLHAPPGVRSVKPNLSPKPTRHMMSGGRSSPSSGPAPYKPPVKKDEDEDVPGYMGLNSSNTSQSRTFRALQQKDCQWGRYGRKEHKIMCNSII